MVLKRQVDIDLIYKLLPILCKQTAALCVRCLKNIVLLHTMTSNCFGVAEKIYVAVNEWMKWMLFIEIMEIISGYNTLFVNI